MITQRAMAVQPAGGDVPPSATQTASGRYIWRHENNHGSVLHFDMFGTTVKLFVADAQYRTNLKWGTYGTDTSLTNFNQRNADNVWFLSGTSSTIDQSQTANPPVVTDAQLQAKWGTASGKTPNLSTDLTARANCDVWMTYQGTTDSQSISGVPSVAYARGLTSFTGITGGCDIPNAYELMVIFIEANYIDALDPTVSSYQNYALGNTAGVNGKRWSFDSVNYARSSSEYDGGSVRRVIYLGECDWEYKSSTCGVVPVREL